MNCKTRQRQVVQSATQHARKALPIIHIQQQHDTNLCCMLSCKLVPAAHALRLTPAQQYTKNSLFCAVGRLAPHAAQHMHQRQLLLAIQQLLPARHELVWRLRHAASVAVCAQPVAVRHCLEARHQAAQVEAAQAGAALQDGVAALAAAGAADLA